jgi:hypothetical protein
MLPQMHAGKWFIEFKLDWKIVCLNLSYPRLGFEYSSDWYDGPHKALVVGPFNVYWNW